MKRIHGVVVGTVSEVDASLGRIKVKFPWMQPEQESHWARIASLLAGDQRGARFMPEIADEALIAFDHGDYEHPYVIGFLWNGVDKAQDGNEHNRLIKTPGGHQLRFEDSDGDKRVKLITDGAHYLLLDDKDQSITLESTRHHKLKIEDQQGKVTLTTQSGGKITLDDVPGKVTIEASQHKIVLEPSGITIESSGLVKMKSAAPMTIESSAAMSIQSSAAMSIQSSAAMNVQSSAVMNLTSSAALNLTSSAAVSITAAAAMSITSSAAMSITSSAAVNLTAGGVLNVTAALANFSGVLKASVVRADLVSATVYTPGVGNIW